MNIKAYRMNSAVEDAASGFKGIITMMQIDTDNSILYLVQPKGLKPNGDIKDAKWFVGGRLRGKDVWMADVPMEILGTQVEDKITGFKGIATSIVYHVSGCIHIQFASKETKETPSQSYDFSILRLEGKAIKKLNEVEVKEEIKKRPSPSAFCSSIR